MLYNKCLKVDKNNEFMIPNELLSTASEEPGDRNHGYSRSLRPKQAAHSSRAMYLSLSESHCSKKRVVQCSMGMRGARRGASSVWVRYLVDRKCRFSCTWLSVDEQNASLSAHVPVDGVLVQLAELPVDGEDVHVVVLLEVVGQQVQRVFTGLEPLLVLVDLHHLKVWTNTKIG